MLNEYKCVYINIHTCISYVDHFMLSFQEKVKNGVISLTENN